MQRTLKFSKYLPGCGWQPFILTVKEKAYELRDESMVQEIPPQARVFRARTLNSRKHFAIKGKHFDFLRIPDDYWTWAFDAVRVGRRIIRENDIDVIYSTSPVPTAHLIAQMLKWLTGKPWVADFRDPWVGNKYDIPSYPLYKLKIEERMERSVLNTSDIVVCNTHLQRDNFATRYPTLKHKLAIIPNGYDNQDFGFNTTYEPSKNVKTFIHIGEIYHDIRNPLNLLKAVQRLRQGANGTNPNIMIKFVGPGPYAYSREFQKTVGELGLDSCIEIINHVPHNECIDLLLHADFLLLLQQSGHASMQIPAKTYEYLRVGKPILTICNGGATADLVKSLNVGLVAKDEVDDIQSCLMTLLAEQKAFCYRHQKICKYDRAVLTEKLAKLFNATI